MSGYPHGLEAPPHGDALLRPGKDYELRGNEIKERSPMSNERCGCDELQCYYPDCDLGRRILKPTRRRKRPDAAAPDYTRTCFVCGRGTIEVSGWTVGVLPTGKHLCSKCAGHE